MILTVTPNVALDVTYHVDAVAIGVSHRVAAVDTCPGGKGVNVARVAAALGVSVEVTGLAGGGTGRRIRAGLAAHGLTDRLVAIEGESRRTVTAVAPDGTATAFNEPGPEIGADDWDRLRAVVRRCLPATRALVLSGSLPPGAPDDAWAQLVEDARAAAVPSILDSSGPALAAALPAVPDVLKPNADELAEVTGEGDPVTAVRSLAAHGSEVVATLGPSGALACTRAGLFRARVPQVVRGNPTGAGDAVVAALAIGILHRDTWPERLRRAVALSAAAVRAPVAGEIDLDWFRSHVAAVPVTRVDAEEIPCH